MSESPFISGTTFQFAWDSTSLGWFKTCARYYQYSMIFGYRKTTAGVHLRFGGVFASAMECYHKARAELRTHDEAELAAVQLALESTWDGEVAWNSGDTKKNRETLIRSIIWYLEHWREDAARTIVLPGGKAAVELSFRFQPEIRVNGTEMVLCGHMDRLVDFNGMLYVQDQKTTSGAIGPYYFEKYSPDNQMSLYTLAGRVIYRMPVAGVMVDAVQVLVGSTTFARGFTMRSERQLSEWLRDAERWMDLAAQYAEQEYYPQNDTSCDKFGGCVFRQICNKDESVRQNYLETEFETRSWNPLEPR